MLKMVFVLSVLLSSTGALAGWEVGKVLLLESYSSNIYIQWDGPNSESCSRKTLMFSASTLGSDEAVSRGYATALTALTAGKTLRVNLNGCNNTRQQVTVVQICANDNCSY